MRTNEELIRDYRAGEADALNELAKQNRGLITVVANDWISPTDQRWDDVFQECSLALLLAAHAFDESRQKKFSTLASVSMNNHMRNITKRASAQKRGGKSISIDRGKHGDHSWIRGTLTKKAPTPFEVVCREMDAKTYLKRIPQSRTQKTVWLCMQGYDENEVGSKLGMSRSMVNQTKRKGIGLLQELCVRHD